MVVVARLVHHEHPHPKPPILVKALVADCCLGDGRAFVANIYLGDGKL